MSHRGIRALVGLATVVVIAGIVALAVGLFRGSFTDAVPVTVVSPRAGLVMNPDAKVKMRGVQVGKVASIESRPNGQAALHLAMDPAQLRFIPANVLVDITSTTVFDRFIRGDYVNGFFLLDLTNARLRKSLLLGTHWGRLGAELVPAPGEPGYLQYQYTPDPLHPGAPGPVAPPVGAPLTPTAAPAPVPAVPLPLPPPGAPPPVPPPPRPLLGPPDPAEGGPSQAPTPPYAIPPADGSG